MKWHIFDAVAKWPSFCATVYTVQQKIQTKKTQLKITRHERASTLAVIKCFLEFLSL